MTDVVWSQQAQDDLAAIRSYIARDSEHYAQLTIDRLVTAPDRLLTWPRSGRIVPEVGDENLRELIVGPYRIVYRVHPDRLVKLAGALVLKEALMSCPGGHGTFVHWSCAGGRVARSLRAIR